MPSKRLDDAYQPKLGLTAADLGEEAYRANLADHPGEDPPHGGDAGTVPIWRSPEARNAPPGQNREDAQEIKLGEDVKPQRGVRRAPGTKEAPR